MFLFGLTGGIASGKSAVAAILKRRGVPVIDADALAREVVAKGSDGLADVVDAFGKGVLLADGELDRRKVAAIVFADEEQRKKLNAIVHPRVSTLTFARAAALRDAEEPLACYEAALIVENGVADAFRPLVVVAAPEEVQIARARARDGSTEEEARARIRAQMPLSDKIAVADYVIDNAGSLEDLEAATTGVLGQICGKLGVDPGRYREGDKLNER